MIKVSGYCRLFLLLGLLLSFSACKNDDKVVNDITTNRWIENTMRSYYYWYGDIPETNKLNFETSPEVFFQSLLSEKDGKDNNQVSGGHYYYSTIKKKSASTRAYLGEGPSLGFEFQNWFFTSNNRYAVSVLYVLPGSPADLAGLRRGDWIHSIDGVAVNNSNIYDLLGSKTVTVGVSDSYRKLFSTRSVELVPATVKDNPVFLTKVYNDLSTGGKKVGYLVYNHFTSGPDGDTDTEYDDDLRQAFARFKAAQVQEFVLDLRYNGGGLVTSAQLLSEMLAPASALGKTFCDLVYSDKQNKTVNYQLRQTGQNLDLPRLIVLTSSRTASASEAVINGLKPFYQVMVIGERTEGKNVGSITLSSDKYEYDLHPIVCRIYNAKGESDYEDGFVPDWTLSEDQRVIEGHVELGDKDNDPLLAVAVYMIRTGSLPRINVARSAGMDIVSGYCSLDEKSGSGVRVPF